MRSLFVRSSVRALIVTGLTAAALIAGGALALRSGARAPLTPAQIAAGTAAESRLVNDGIGHTIGRPAIVAPVPPRATMTPATVATTIPARVARQALARPR